MIVFYDTGFKVLMRISRKMFAQSLYYTVLFCVLYCVICHYGVIVTRCCREMPGSEAAVVGGGGW